MNLQNRALCFFLLAGVLLTSRAFGADAPSAVDLVPTSSAQLIPVDDYRRTTVLERTAMGVSALHILDNFLSRRTFSYDLVSTLTQLTYLIPPLFDYLDAGPLLRIIDWVAMLAGHIFGQWLAPATGNNFPNFYDRWTNGSDRLGINSPVLGRTSQAIFVTFDSTIVAALVSNIADGIDHGFTWRRVRR